MENIKYFWNGTNKINLELDKLIKQVQEDGAGEIILTSIDIEGKRNGFDLDYIRKWWGG